jgi:hypothetical protein
VIKTPCWFRGCRGLKSWPGNRPSCGVFRDFRQLVQADTRAVPRPLFTKPYAVTLYMCRSIFRVVGSGSK